MLDFLIKNVIAVTMDDERRVIKDAILGVKDGRIAHVGSAMPSDPARETIDGDGAILMPGLVNTHAHVAMTLLRGYADDYKLRPWLFEKVFPAEAKIDERCAMAGVRLGFAEMLRYGVTSVSDMYFHIRSEAEIARDCGIRLNVSNSLLAPDDLSWDPKHENAIIETREALEFHGADEGRVRVDAAIHAEYTSKPRMWRYITDMARDLDLVTQLHLSETKSEHEECIARNGMTPARMFESCGVFDRPTVAAHAVWVTDDDIDIMARHSVTAAHCPVSNLKLGSGFAPVAKMLRSGVNVSLGTDGMCSNNSHDMFEEIKLAALMQKGLTGEPDSMPAWDALKLATVGGAKAQGREGEIGMLREGCYADLILVSTKGVSMFPMYDPISSLVYCARGDDVVMTMVQGRILYRDGEFKTIDVEDARREMREYAIPRIIG